MRHVTGIAGFLTAETRLLLKETIIRAILSRGRAIKYRINIAGTDTRNKHGARQRVKLNEIVFSSLKVNAKRLFSRHGEYIRPSLIFLAELCGGLFSFADLSRKRCHSRD